MFKSKKIKEILNPKNLPIGEIKTLYANEHLDIIYEACTACYDNTKELTQIQKREYVKKRVLAGHTSVLEHGWLTMVIKDMHPFHLGAMCKMSMPLHYLYTSVVNTEPDKCNVFISGSIRAFRHFAMEATDEDKVSVFYSHIMNEVSTYAIDAYFIDLINDETIPFNYQFTLLPLDPNDYTKDLVLNRDNIDKNDMFDIMMDFTNFDSGVGRINKLKMDLLEYGFTKREIDVSYAIPILFKNLSRISTHQLVRHRNAITQESMRYVDASPNGFEVPVFEGMKERYEIELFGNKVNIPLDILAEEMMKVYNQLKNQGMKMEDARYFLISGVKCKRVYMTFTPFSLNKFIELRTDPHAAEEIRRRASSLQTSSLWDSVKVL
jgi:thymidylate synthase ThyX